MGYLLRYDCNPIRLRMGGCLCAGAEICAANTVAFGAGGGKMKLAPKLRHVADSDGAGISGEILGDALGLDELRRNGGHAKCR